MGKPVVYIDGKEGTTGLQIYDRLAGREDIQLLLIDEDKRKDASERKRLMNEADLVFLCLPDAAAVEAVELAENPATRIIDASTAHRTAPGWTYGFPELGAEQREAVRTAKRVANPGCYATGFISLIAPLVRRGVLAPDAPLACHAVSGYTGGGKKAIAQYEAEDREAELREQTDQTMKGIIETECAAYIVDKAASFGIPCSARVECQAGEEGTFLPVRARVTGPLTQGQRDQLARILEEDLGIPKAGQRYDDSEEETP